MLLFRGGSFGKRIIAWLIDTLVIQFILQVFLIGFLNFRSLYCDFLLSQRDWLDVDLDTIGGIFNSGFFFKFGAVLGLLLSWLYYVVMESSKLQRRKAEGQGILFGVVAIVMAIPSMEGSLYIAAIGATEIAVGVMQIKISSEKIRDLNAGNNYSSPKVFGMDQEAVNTADIVVSVVGLSVLFKPNNLKAADQFKDSQRLAAFKSTMNDVNIKMNPANYKFHRERVGALSTGNGSLNRGFTRYWIERNGDKPFIQFNKGKGGGDSGPKPKPHEVDPPIPPKDPGTGVPNLQQIIDNLDSTQGGSLGNIDGWKIINKSFQNKILDNVPDIYKYKGRNVAIIGHRDSIIPFQRTRGLNIRINVFKANNFGPGGWTEDKNFQWD